MDSVSTRAIDKSVLDNLHRIKIIKEIKGTVNGILKATFYRLFSRDCLWIFVTMTSRQMAELKFLIKIRKRRILHQHNYVIYFSIN